MKPTKPETARRAYIRLLSERANLADAADDEDHRDAILYSELIDKGYLRGTAVRDASKGGMTVGAAVTEITLEGRLFLQRLKSEEKQESVIGRFKTNWPLFSGLAGIIVGWLLSSWHPFGQQRQDVGIQQRDSASSQADQQQAVTKPPAKAAPSASAPIQKASPTP